MKIKALSHYDGDMDTRYGDCILLYDNSSIVVYDCGHQRHAEKVISFLKENENITIVHIVVSHNDNDHTAGVCKLIESLAINGDIDVRIYTHQLLKHADEILEIIDDGRRTHDSIKKAILSEFDNIKSIIEKAQACGFDTIEALEGTSVGACKISGPTKEEFISTAAKAIDNRVSNMIGEGHAEETTMNAASVQLTATIGSGCITLLCGDASPDFLKDISYYDLIQLPHHGQLDDAKAIFDILNGDAYKKKYLISDNTGSGETSGGSDKLVEYMKEEKYDPAYNTKHSIVDISELYPISNAGKVDSKRRFLGDLDSISKCIE